MRVTASPRQIEPNAIPKTRFTCSTACSYAGTSTIIGGRSRTSPCSVGTSQNQ